MKTKILEFILIITLIISCKEVENNNLDLKKDVVTETPETLDENQVFDVSSFPRRHNMDLVLKLYNEALEKNSRLENLNNKILKMSKLKNDSLDEYLKFSQNNKRYWLTVFNYINEIQDSILRQSTFNEFKNFESEYTTNMLNYEKKLTAINEKTISLNDQLILIKVFITEQMIKNYQTNEKPDINALNNIINEYDKLLKEVEVYLKDLKEFKK